MNFFFIAIASVFGILFGSFLNVLIWRLPRDEKPNGRSHCPNCGHVLVWYDLIPVLSFVLMRARCRYCRGNISMRYPLIEIITAALFGVAAASLPLTEDPRSWLLMAHAAFVIAICIIVFVIDLDHYLILDKIVYPAIGIAFIFLVAFDFTSPTYSYTWFGLLAALGASIPFLVLWYFSKGKWMGLGDVKFLVFMGLALGVQKILVALFISFGLGAIVGVGLILVGKKQFSSKLPFGTFLSVATVIALLYGHELWSMYWGLFSL